MFALMLRATATLLLPPILTLILILILAQHYLHANAPDLRTLAWTLGASAGAAWFFGYTSLALLHAIRWGDLWTKIFIPALIGVLTALASIVITAQLMFINSHDLILLTLLLVFAIGVSVPFAMFAARSLADRVAVFGRAAQAMADGHLDTRVRVQGTDEIDRLAISFNSMARRLEEANHMQLEAETARRQMIAAISHDLRTPLSSIQAMVEAIQDGVVDGDTSDVYLAQILDEARGLTGLINDLFELSRIDAGALRLQLEASPAASLIRDALDSMQPKATKREITLDGQRECVGLQVLADASQIQRVFYNLVDNALRYTPHGGKVTVYAVEAGQEVVFNIEDTGPGIDEADLPHVFESFYRADRSRHDDGGAGLGLAIARGIVEAHGGRIWAAASSTGAHFSFALPKVV